MKVNDRTVQVSFRLPQQLVERMRDITSTNEWPPPPSQTEIVARGIELVLRRLEKRGSKVRAEAD
jgi:Arc/MetJ-type ribon-helix-helix transcriptional regulator